MEIAPSIVIKRLNRRLRAGRKIKVVRTSNDLGLSWALMDGALLVRSFEGVAALEEFARDNEALALVGAIRIEQGSSGKLPVYFCGLRDHLDEIDGGWLNPSDAARARADHALEKFIELCEEIKNG
jgi:hypothetical protein